MLVEFDHIPGFFDLGVMQGVRVGNTSKGYERSNYAVEFLVSGKWSKVRACGSDGEEADKIVKHVVQRVNEEATIAAMKLAILNNL